MHSSQLILEFLLICVLSYVYFYNSMQLSAVCMW
jgi:hypothetical protein